MHVYQMIMMMISRRYDQIEISLICDEYQYSGVPYRVQPAQHPQLRARATLGYREKKMSPGKVCKSCTTQYIYINIYYTDTHTVYVGNDYYFQIIIEVAQLRQHKQRLNDLRTQHAARLMEFILLLLAPTKPKHKRKS